MMNRIVLFSRKRISIFLSVFILNLSPFIFRAAQAETVDTHCSAQGDFGENYRAGRYCVLKDGPITCILNDSYSGAGISCSTSAKSLIVPSEPKTYDLQDVRGYVYRKIILDQVCFLYRASGQSESNGAGMSCLPLRGK